MKPFILVSDGFNKTLFEDLKKVEEFEVYPEAKVSQDKIKELLPKVNGIVIRSSTTMNKELIDMAPNLKYIIRAGAGTDNIDKAYCQEKGIAVSNTPGANNNSAAEHAIALMMTVLRKTAWAHRKLQEGGWDKASFLGNELSSKKIGIIGMGEIGLIVAKRLSGFDPRVSFFRGGHGEIPPYCKKTEDLQEIFRESDIITLHMPKTADTQNLITKDLLAMMKPSAILINCARGGIVNEDDLYEILKEGKIRGAGIDVYGQEPLQEDSNLRSLENAVLTPHLGASTEEAQLRVGEMTINQLVEFFNNENLLNEVRV